MPRAWCLIREQVHYRREAFRGGLEKAGYQLCLGGPPAPPRPGDILVIWNRYGHMEEWARKFEVGGGRVLIAENGYLGNDENGRQYYAIALSGHNGSGSWPSGGIPLPKSEDFGGRWARLGIELKPWRADGEHVLVCPQRGIGPKQYAQLPGWEESVVNRLRALTRRPIRVRPHPGRKAPERTLAEDLANCWALVTWASNAGTHALVAGIPVFFEGTYWVCAGAGERSVQRIERPAYPERLPVFERLAWAQWSVAEIASGEPFRRLLA